MKRTSGFTLVEILIGVAIFVIVAMAVYQSYASLYATIGSSHLKLAAASLVNEEMETVRNLPYSDVGVSGSIPSGKLVHVKTVTRDRFDFTVTTTVRNIDDSFDGVIDGTPDDHSPADYKLVEIEVTCAACRSFTPVLVTGRVAPKSLETASTNGALFIQVFDANGQPVKDADVHLVNASTTPPITLDDTTTASGLLAIVDAPPSPNNYQLTVTKPGFSTDKTYKTGATGNPNPSKPHATVTLQNVTQISFAIDKVSTLNISAVDTSCSAVGSFPFTLKGAKLIGTPLVYKYNQNLTTNGAGNTTVSNLEWDTYSFTTSSGTYEIRGMNPLSPLQVLPNSVQNMQLVLGPKTPNTLLVSVTDSATGLPLSGAAVTLNGSTLYTGQGSVTQTDWSGSSGQATSSNPASYDTSTNIAVGTPVGDATLTKTLGVYSASGTLTSSAFDIGTSSLFQEISWNPTSEPVAAGATSTKFQFAVNDDGGVWDFRGPDGTNATYYTIGNRDLSTQSISGRYAKYKMFLSTASSTITPNISDVSFTFTSGCVPPGQVAFSGLTSGNKTFSVTKSGYTSYTGTANASTTWQVLQIGLTPQ